MSKYFNVSAVCKPESHYMVDISDKIIKIKAMVEQGQYFTINRARQYGKTTTLRALTKSLTKDYMVVNLDFQMLGEASFRTENIFSLAFARIFLKAIKRMTDGSAEKIKDLLQILEVAILEKRDDFVLQELFEILSDICGRAARPLVLIIDEVDSASNNQVFLDFLAQLRVYYIHRDEMPTFQSVILAGVYDVKNLKRKLRPEDAHKVNSPWNIAADFDVVMSFAAQGIAGMLEEYESDYHTGMDIKGMSEMLYDYTSGYPFLVSRLCKLIDEQIAGSPEFPDKSSAWTNEGFLEAVKLLLNEKNTLFESLSGKLIDYQELNIMLRTLLFTGKPIVYNSYEPSIGNATMFGFIKNRQGTVVMSNRIFETWLYNLYLSSAELHDLDLYKASLQDKNQFIVDGHLNMRLILERFVMHFHDLYGGNGDAFIEDEGRKYFLLYLRPIINGVGNYYIEAQTRSLGRTDVIVDYRGEQFVIEMKIWRGDEYNTRGEEQLVGYLEDYRIEKGYMVSFNFNKKKQIGVFERVVGNKTLIEAVV